MLGGTNQFLKSLTEYFGGKMKEACAVSMQATRSQDERANI